MASTLTDVAAIVSTEWVHAHRADESVRIVESDEDVLLYEQGHIPGAVKLDWHTDLQDQTVREYISRDRFVVRRGLHLWLYGACQSIIGGGHIVLTVRASDRTVHNHGDRPGLLLCLNQDTMDRHFRLMGLGQ